MCQPGEMGEGVFWCNCIGSLARVRHSGYLEGFNERNLYLLFVVSRAFHHFMGCPWCSLCAAACPPLPVALEPQDSSALCIQMWRHICTSVVDQCQHRHTIAINLLYLCYANNCNCHSIVLKACLMPLTPGHCWLWRALPLAITCSGEGHGLFNVSR